MNRLISWLSLSSALYLASSPAYAGEPASAPPRTEAELTKAQAAQRFDRGLQLFNEGDTAGALAEFKQTYALMPNPIVLYNIGLVYAAMSRPVDAVDALTPVVDSASLSPEQRQRAQKTLADQQQRIARVSVSTVPDGARIDVDGVEVARSPLSAPLRVAEGRHVIGAVAEGYAPAHKEIIVAGNAEASVSFELILGIAKRPANLTIRSRIPRAEVLLDQQAIGKTPLASSLAIPAGPHTIELRRAGYQSGRQEVEVGEGSTAEVTFDLAVDASALAKHGADLTISVREPNLNLSIDREPLRPYTGTLRLPAGVHHLYLEQAGFLPFEQEITLDSQKPLLLTPYLMPTPEARRAHDENVRLHRTWGWILSGAGAAVASGGVVWVAVNGSKKSDALSTYNHWVAQVPNGPDEPVCDSSSGSGDAAQCNAEIAAAKDSYDSAKARDIPGYIAIGVGSAALATGVVLLLTGESAHRFEPPPSQAKLKAPTWAVRPGPGRIGLGLSAAF
jgi:PEGA domain-containing protein